MVFIIISQHRLLMDASDFGSVCWLVPRTSICYAQWQKPVYGLGVR